MYEHPLFKFTWAETETLSYKINLLKICIHPATPLICDEFLNTHESWDEDAWSP